MVRQDCARRVVVHEMDYREGTNSETNSETE